jgi:hypothetical protein
MVVGVGVVIRGGGGRAGVCGWLAAGAWAAGERPAVAGDEVPVVCWAAALNESSRNAVTIPFQVRMTLFLFSLLPQ